MLGWAPTSTWGQKVPAWVDAGELPFTPDRRAHLGWVHVDDFAAAVDRALTVDGVVGNTYVVATGHVTWGTFLDEIMGWFDDPADPFVPSDEPPLQRRWDASAAQEDLGWEPTVTFDAAMAEAASHHR